MVNILLFLMSSHYIITVELLIKKTYAIVRVQSKHASVCPNEALSVPGGTFKVCVVEF